VKKNEARGKIMKNEEESREEEMPSEM